MRVLAVICARGGSKGLPRKNVLDLGGKPLIAWTVAAALASQRIDRTILSSDDEEIIAAAKTAGCEVPFIRPRELASDTASIYDVLLHAIDHAGQVYTHVVLLQATSPLRRAEDIDACIGLCLNVGVKAAISVAAVQKPPQWMYHIDEAGRLRPAFENAADIGRRQDAPNYVVPNGAVYVADCAWLRKNRSFVGSDTLAYLMPPERSIDIDTHFDLIVARAIFAETKRGDIV